MHVNVYFSASSSLDVLHQSSFKSSGGGSLDEGRASMSSAALDVLDSFTDYQPVNIDGVVSTVSSKWLPLCPGETIVSHYGITPMVTLSDYLLSVWTVGVFYIMVVIPKKRKHIVHILTTKRVIEIYLQVLSCPI